MACSANQELVFLTLVQMDASNFALGKKNTNNAFTKRLSHTTNINCQGVVMKENLFNLY